MTDMDSAKHKVEEAKGSAKEGIGNLTDDEQMQDEGQAEQAEAKGKQALDSLKDSAHQAADSVKKTFDR